MSLPRVYLEHPSSAIWQLPLLDYLLTLLAVS